MLINRAEVAQRRSFLKGNTKLPAMTYALKRQERQIEAQSHPPIHVDGQTAFLPRAPYFSANNMINRLYSSLIKTPMLQLLKVAVARLYLSAAHVIPIYPRPNGDPTYQDSVPPIFRVPFHGFNSLDLYEVTVNKLQQLLSDGRLTSVEYINFCLERIHKVSLPQRWTDL